MRAVVTDSIDADKTDDSKNKTSFLSQNNCRQRLEEQARLATEQAAKIT
jgi:hypothetical protein